ncbi:CHAT domain-containing protein [Dactylonectria macrodidyma]|uniref:CHAT domain-containing protein n=1 Tax=Dactylonectria macrodidyma TaxID=307937 RepID=A0A9P9J8K3_9HYPO|nr:CHAT domain-containing protein [Dactylonectria macrodidyma]
MFEAPLSPIWWVLKQVESYRASRLQDAALDICTKYLRSGDSSDLETAFQRVQQAINATPEDHPGRAKIYQNLAFLYVFKYRRSEELSDLDMMIQKSQEALNLLSNHDTRRARLIQVLAFGYYDKQKITRTLPDLESAIQQYEKLLEVIPESHADQSRRLKSMKYLGYAYHNKYFKTRNGADLDMAIRRYRDVAEATSLSDSDLGVRFQNIGLGYFTRFQRTGSFADLEAAMQKFRDAVDATPSDHPYRVSRIRILGFVHWTRYRTSRAIADLEVSIQQFQWSLDAVPDHHRSRSDLLHGLGMGYHERHIRLQESSDIEKAIQLYQESLDLVSQDPVYRAHRLQGLGCGYHSKYESTKEMADLDRAIQFQHASVNETQDGSFSLVLRQTNLGVSYSLKHKATKLPEHLESSIQQFQSALDLTPESHPSRAAVLRCLGFQYGEKYGTFKSRSDLEKAIQFYESSLGHFISPPNERLKSGKVLLGYYARMKNWPLAYQTACSVASLVPLLAPRSLENLDKQYLITEFIGLASDSAAAALMVQKTPYEAIRLLELARGIIVGSLSDMRADISDLRQKHPQLAEEYTNLRDQLDTPTELLQVGQPNPLSALTTQEDELNIGGELARHVDQRYSANLRLEETIEAIRKLPGFGSFLQFPSEDELRDAAASGTIVVINVSDYRCDALIIEKCGLRTLRLPSLRSNDVRDHVATLNPWSMNTELLGWLWDTTAKPVLTSLGLTESSLDSWPRIWWIPTGPLAKFPIHAAGDYSSGNYSDTVLDLVISSYSSSVKALVQSQQSRLRMVRKPENVVLIGMRELQFTGEEINKLERICGSMKLQVRKPNHLKKDVLDALKGSDIFHFAGHGQTNPLNPSESSLILSDEGLTVTNLFEINLHNHKPFLAYLSACGTGQVKHDTLIDEGIHLIAACQLAGFRHVVGTLWEVNDRTCVDATVISYTWMKDGHMNDESVSLGVHHASRTLRTQWVQENTTRGAHKHEMAARREFPHEDTDASCLSHGKTRDPRDVLLHEDIPLYWVPYVHFGV